jgi:hypothetical protein
MDPEYIVLTEPEEAKAPRRRYTAVALPDTLADGVAPFPLSEFPQLGVRHSSIFLFQADCTISLYSNRFTEKWAKNCILTALGDAYARDALDRFDTFGTYADMLNFLAETLEERDAKFIARTKTFRRQCCWGFFFILLFVCIMSGVFYGIANWR